MAKSKKRGGEKAHRKRLMSRNNNIKGQIKRQEKLFIETMEKQLEAYKNQLSAETETNTSENVKLNTDGFIQSSEIL